MVAFRGLEQALAQWVREAIDDLIARTEPEELHGLPQWGRDADGVLRQRVRPLRRWNPLDTSRVMRLDSWRQVEEALKVDELTARHLNKLVGTASGATRLDADSVAGHFLLTPDELTDRDAAFGRRYEEFRRFLEADHFEFVVVWPLMGLSSRALPASLGDDVTIDFISDNELILALSVGLIPTTFPGMSIYPHSNRNLACLRYRYLLPKVVGSLEEPMNLQVEIMENRLDRIQDRLECAFALLFAEDPGISGRANFTNESILRGGVVYRSFSVAHTRAFHQVDIDAKQCAMLTSTWRQLRKLEGLKNQQGLMLALRRLSYRAHRQRVEDEIVDLFVAGEALYLSDLGGNSELGFRFALRAAALCHPESLSMTRRQVFDLMKSAYGIRSTIVHGQNPKQKDLRLKGTHVSLKEFLKAIENVVRGGLLEALDRAVGVPSRWPPDWDGMTLPAADES